ncbi:hypothetical protein GGR55DRAFT_652255 [Xylaria sp. FL0064]|nr:hypothetical protein GGR55DRAFT_652255 [Xylaria sp. FL0064]
MSFNIKGYDGHANGKPDGGILYGLRDMVQRTDPRGCYYIEPTWRINGVPISRCPSPGSHRPASAIRQPDLGIPPLARRLTLKQHLRTLHDSELREIIMNFCLKNLDIHKDVVELLKRMQKKKPRPISCGERVQNPTAGLYLYCRTHRELVEIVIEMARRDETRCFEQDVRDLARVIREKEASARHVQ